MGLGGIKVSEKIAEVKVRGEIAAVCSNCQKTTGKIYDPYWCADCKIKELEESSEFHKEQNSNLNKQKNMWVNKYNEESILKTKYKHAFDALFEKVTGK